MSNKLCAWVSRHKPTRQQLNELGHYDIVQVKEAAYKNAGEVWATILQHCRQHPDLIVAVLPTVMLGELVDIVAPVPVIRTPGFNDRRTGTFHWDGTWHRVTGLRLCVQSWMPPEVLK